jgi:hypothetical protein
MRSTSVVITAICAICWSAAGCSGVSSLATTKPLVTDGGEVAAVHAKSDEAVKGGKYAEAWDLEAAAGQDRGRLESIALASLAADEGPYEKMFGELTKKFHGLSPEARARVGAESRKAMEAKKWGRAADIELAAAEDAPAYKAAFGVYERTPPDDALAVLERIEKARRKATTPAPSSGGADSSGGNSNGGK